MAKLTLITSSIQEAGKSMLSRAIIGDRKALILDQSGYTGDLMHAGFGQIKTAEVIVFEEVWRDEKFRDIQKILDHDNLRFHVLGMDYQELPLPEVIIISINKEILPEFLRWFHRKKGKHIHLDRKYSYSEIIDPNSDLRKEVDNG